MPHPEDGVVDRGCDNEGLNGLSLGKPKPKALSLSLSLQKPVAARPWNGTYNATFTRAACLQSEEEGIPLSRQSEDCLYLNVYTQNVSRAWLEVNGGGGGSGGEA